MGMNTRSYVYVRNTARKSVLKQVSLGVVWVAFWGFFCGERGDVCRERWRSMEEVMFVN